MKSIEQLKAEHAKQLSELEAAHTIANACPVPPDNVMHTATGAPWVSYKVKGFAGLLELLYSFTAIVPFAEYKNGCTQLQPLELLKLSELEKENVCAEYALMLDVNQGLGPSRYGPQAKGVFFARLDSVGIIRVNADIVGQGYIDTCPRLGCSAQFKNNGAYVRGSKRPNAALNGHADKIISWASGEESAHYSYLFNADYYFIDQRGDELSEVTSRLQNMADEFDIKEGN